MAGKAVTCTLYSSCVHVICCMAIMLKPQRSMREITHNSKYTSSIGTCDNDLVPNWNRGGSQFEDSLSLSPWTGLLLVSILTTRFIQILCMYMSFVFKSCFKPRKWVLEISHNSPNNNQRSLVHYLHTSEKDFESCDNCSYPYSFSKNSWFGGECWPTLVI